MTSTVDGLVSGLDTSALINQLMQLQAQPQARLKTALSSTTGEITAFQTLNTKMSSLRTAAETVGKAATWGAATATSSSTTVTGTAASGAVNGSVTFSVTSLATAKSSVSTQSYGSLTAGGAITDTPLEIHGADGTLKATITPSGSSLQSVVQAINGSKDAGVKAAAVQVSPGVYRLQLTASSTGTANDFSVTGSGGAPLAGLTLTTASAAKNAVLHVGDADAGYDISSSSNTVEGVMPGLTLKVTSLATDVTVQTSTDTTAISNSIKAMVDAANAALTSIKSLSSSGTVGSDGSRTGVGALSGEGLTRTLTSTILRSVTSGVGGLSLSQYGISTDRDGTIDFDSTKFTKALGDDPAKLKELFTSTTVGATGLGTRLADVAKQAAQSGGSIGLAIEGRTSTQKDLQKRIDDWDTTLATRRKSLQVQYANLETTLSRLQSQGTWLSGQISSLR
ncbi:flagellar filament capping protein FliD [Angustibacter aerolatus]